MRFPRMPRQGGFAPRIPDLHYPCSDCGQCFTFPVWHCPCGHHNIVEEPECGNCHEPRPASGDH